MVNKLGGVNSNFGLCKIFRNRTFMLSQQLSMLRYSRNSVLLSVIYLCQKPVREVLTSNTSWGQLSEWYLCWSLMHEFKMVPWSRLHLFPSLTPVELSWFSCIEFSALSWRSSQNCVNFKNLADLSLTFRRLTSTIVVVPHR